MTRKKTPLRFSLLYVLFIPASMPSVIRLCKTIYQVHYI